MTPKQALCGFSDGHSDSMQFYTTDLSSLSLSSVKDAGGKAACLGELVRAGFPVPAGFVVVTRAFDEFLDSHDLRGSIDAALHGRTDYPSLVLASETIRTKMLKKCIHEQVASEISEAYKKLETDRVAVRSSATVEDSETAAWSGQLATYLNTTEDYLLTNVMKCWISLFKANSLLYGLTHGMTVTQVSVAVVVEKMIDANVSGVAFTIHPENQDRNLMVIEAGWGLGESIVQGQIIPDRYVVDKKDGVIVDLRISDQAKMLVGDEDGVADSAVSVLVDVPLSKRQKQKLTGEQISELADLCIRVERHFGIPSDIEWAYSNGAFFLLQSRPITTL